MTKRANQLRLLAISLGIDMPDWIEIARTHTGHHQESAGAWSWFAVDVGGREILGSCHSVTSILAAPNKVRVSHGDDCMCGNGNCVWLPELCCK